MQFIIITMPIDQQTKQMKYLKFHHFFATFFFFFKFQTIFLLTLNKNDFSSSSNCRLFDRFFLKV